MFVNKKIINVLEVLRIQSLILSFSNFFLSVAGYCRFSISSRACSSAWLERIPDKDEAGGSSPPRPTSETLESGGISSAGRAPALQAGGQRFDPAILHQNWMCCISGVMSGLFERIAGLLFYDCY